MTFDPGRFEEIAERRGLALGRPVTCKDVTESTNDDALAGGRNGAPHGSLYVAELQTKGRGRRGNRWFGAPGQCLTFTVLLRPSLPLERVSGLALVAGLAVRAAVEAWLRRAERSDRVLVKWPNDVVIGGQKLCGILAESQVRGTELVAVALGIGLNVGTVEHDTELSRTATSLAAFGLQNQAFEPLLADILAELEPRLRLFISDPSGVAEELKNNDALFGRRLKVGDLEGLGAGINRSGSLLVREDNRGDGDGGKEESGGKEETNGVPREVVAGHVELLDG